MPDAFPISHLVFNCQRPHLPPLQPMNFLTPGQSCLGHPVSLVLSLEPGIQQVLYKCRCVCERSVIIAHASMCAFLK